MLTFTTSGPPVATTNARHTVSATAGNLNGSAIPTAQTPWAGSSTPPPIREPATRRSARGAGHRGHGSRIRHQRQSPYSQSPSGLSAGTTYYFCALASNSYGTTIGAVLRSPSSASISLSDDLDTTPLSGTTAQLDGSANPGGARHDRPGSATTRPHPGTCDDVFGTRTPATGGTDLGSGNSAQTSRRYLGPDPGTTYYALRHRLQRERQAFGAVLRSPPRRHPPS